MNQQQDIQHVPLDILLAQIKNPLIVSDEHTFLIKQKHEQMPKIINSNFELLADKYLLLSNALPGCSPELIVDEFEKVLQVVEKCVNQLLEKMRKVLTDLQAFANYDTQVLKGYLTQATDVFQRCFALAEKELSQQDVDFLMENFSNPENPIQTHLLTLILERNQNLQNVMQKVYAEQVEFATLFRAQFDSLCNTNHFQPLNQLLNNQKQFWTSRVKKQVATQQFLMEQQNQALTQSQMQIRQSTISNRSNSCSLTQSQIMTVEQGNQQMIETLLKLRNHTQDLMQQHDKDCKKIGKRHCKLEGGGSFGYCWTGGYGWRGTIYEGLDLCHECNQCHVLNQDMHNTAKKLYELEYRDKGTWWVQAWFLYKK